MDEACSPPPQDIGTEDPLADSAERVFIEARDWLKALLTPQQQETFPQRKLRDLKHRILSIQQDQERHKTMMNFARIQFFIERFAQFDGACKALELGDQEPLELSPYIWGPPHYIIQTAQTDSGILNEILDAYRQFGSRTPTLEPYISLIKEEPELMKCLAFMYHDLAHFHGRIIQLLSYRDWKKTFHSSWKDYKKEFETLLDNFDSHAKLLENAFVVTRLQEDRDENRQLIDHIVRSQDHYHQSQRARGVIVNGIQDINRHLTDHTIRYEDDRQALRQFMMRYEEDRAERLRRSEEERKQRKEEQKKRALKWMLNPGVRQDKYHKKHTELRRDFPNTGTWILNRPTIFNWINEETPAESIVWLNGKKGAGKTILASVIIEQCKKIPEFNTSYFYCREGDQHQNTSLAILKEILLQMTLSIEELLPYASERQESRHDILKDEHDVDSLLRVYCNYPQKHFIIIDGLDECGESERRKVFKFWEEVIDRCERQYESGRIRVLLISQDLADFRKMMEDADYTEILDLETGFTKADIGRFVERKAMDLREKFPLTPEEIERIQKMVCLRAEDMFLFASVVMDNLQEQPTIQCLKMELEEKKFPKTLEEAYAKIITRMKEHLHPNAWEQARKIFALLIGAKRHLAWHELQAALSIDLDNKEVDYHNRKLRDDPRKICGSLIHVFDNSRIEFTHSSTKSYLVQNEDLNAQTIECDLLDLSLRYLTFECFLPELEDDEREQFATDGLYGFQDYAVSHWKRHVKCLVEDVSELFEDPVKGPTYESKLEQAMEDFVALYIDDSDSEGERVEETAPVRSSQASSSQRSSQGEQNREVDPAEYCQKLANRRFYPQLLRLCQHISDETKLPPKERGEVSPKRLRESIEKSRKAIKELAAQSNRGAARDRLHEYYGRWLHKCPRVKCDFFHRGFNSDKMAEKHLNRHDRPFQCPVASCSLVPFGFSSNRDLDRHVRQTHPDQSDKGCPFDAVVARPQTTEAKHQCTICPKRFTRRMNLKAHVDNHYQIKNYECGTCGKAFTRSNDMRRHHKTHVRRGGG